MISTIYICRESESVVILGIFSIPSSFCSNVSGVLPFARVQIFICPVTACVVTYVGLCIGNKSFVSSSSSLCFCYFWCIFWITASISSVVFLLAITWMSIRKFLKAIIFLLVAVTVFFLAAVRNTSLELRWKFLDSE